MTLLNANIQPPAYPLTEADLRAALPNVSFQRNPTEGDLSPFGWHRVIPSPRPADTRIERYEDTAEEIDGAWQQVWVARAATAEEQTAWDEANRPAPDWLGFAGWLYQFPAIAAAMEVARASTDPQGEPATTGLPAAMDEARLRQNYPAFALSWGQFLLASHMPAADLAEIVGKAVACHLPAEFVAALQPEAHAP